MKINQGRDFWWELRDMNHGGTVLAGSLDDSWLTCFLTQPRLHTPTSSRCCLQWPFLSIINPEKSLIGVTTGRSNLDKCHIWDSLRWAQTESSWQLTVAGHGGGLERGCVWVQCLWRPEGVIRPPGAGVDGDDWELWDSGKWGFSPKAVWMFLTTEPSHYPWSLAFLTCKLVIMYIWWMGLRRQKGNRSMLVCCCYTVSLSTCYYYALPHGFIVL